ncbi:MAG TPA: hypothetical protein VL442_03945 [Mucilaginibacter sp.]|nr:hypothetical protein [Mucilaginibacter sp.]
MGNNSVLITPHNYYRDYDQSATSGIYCAQLISFKNTADGNNILGWWADACIKWCSSQYEEGKWADQKYLDSWPYMFNGVYICKDIYAGVAPWNAINYKSEHDIEKIIFYHFHDLTYFSDNSWFIGGYEVPNLLLEKIYRPYTRLLKSICNEVGVNDCLNTKDKRSFIALSLKYKVGSYILDMKTASRTFFNTLFYIKRRNFYKNNFIK